MKAFLLCLLLFPNGILAQDTYTIEEQTLITLNEHLYTSYILDHNTEPLEKTACDDFKLIAGIGIVETKAQAISGVENLDVTSLIVAVDEVKVKNELGIIIGSLEMNGTVMGRPVPRIIRFSSVFIKENNEWRLQLRTMTPVRM